MLLIIKRAAFCLIAMAIFTLAAPGALRLTIQRLRRYASHAPYAAAFLCRHVDVAAAAYENITIRFFILLSLCYAFACLRHLLTLALLRHCLSDASVDASY